MTIPVFGPSARTMSFSDWTVRPEKYSANTQPFGGPPVSRSSETVFTPSQRMAWPTASNSLRFSNPLGRNQPRITRITRNPRQKIQRGSFCRGDRVDLNRLSPGVHRAGKLPGPCRGQRCEDEQTKDERLHVCLAAGRHEVSSSGACFHDPHAALLGIL